MAVPVAGGYIKATGQDIWSISPVRLKPVHRLVVLSSSHPILVALLALAACIAATLFVGGHFEMTTKTEALISPKLGYRQREAAMDAAFPQLADPIVVVIDGRTPELAEDAAARLAQRLAADKAAFKNVQRPDGGPFFAREGLLYGSLAEVQSAMDKLVAAQPFLGQLAYDPSLRGVMNLLSTTLLGVEDGETTLNQIDKPLASLAGPIEAANAGKPAFFSWQEMIGGGGEFQAPLRRLILVAPVLDYHSLMPGARASAVIRQAANDLGLIPADGVSVRLTGSAALDDEEFASLAHNIGLVSTVIVCLMLLMLWLATRSARIVAAIMTTTIAGLLLTTALGLAALKQFNLISVAFIPLFVGLGIDFGIQLSVRFRAERLSEPDPRTALERAAEALGGSLTLAAAGICLGFLAFLPTSYIGISELGVIAALGMVVALVLNVTLLPALLLLLRAPLQSLEVGRRALAPLDAFLYRRRKLVLGAFAVAMAASIATLPPGAFRLQRAAPSRPEGRGHGDAARPDARSEPHGQHHRRADAGHPGRGEAGGPA